MVDAARLKEVIQAGKRLIIVLHDNPDPDAIAAGWFLHHIGESLGVRSTILYGGSLSRAENRTMVRLLRIPLQPLQGDDVRWLAEDRYALVDTQPGTGNNSFPPELRANIILDHHPAPAHLDADLVDVRMEHGCTATMALDYFRSCGLELSSELATAAAYAIVSETQDLERDAAPDDRSAFQELFPLVNLQTLGKIRHPAREREYYRTIARAMRRVVVGKNTCICHIGSVPYAEVVAEVADFLVAMKQVTWCLVTGFHHEAIAVSLRTTHTDANAEQMIREVLEGIGRGGGHGMIAGGAIPCSSPAQYRARAGELTDRFLDAIPRRSREKLRPLLEEEQGPLDDKGVPVTAPGI